MMIPLKYLGPPLLVGSMSLLTFPTVSAEECTKPVAETPGDVYNEPSTKSSEKRNDSTELERYVNQCRQEIAPIKAGVVDFIAATNCYIRDSTATVRANIDYLRRAPQEVQVGVIAVSALAGSLLGIRRSLFRKIWYGTIGGVGAAAVVYPEETKIIAKGGYQMAKCYGTIAYNFVLGRVSPGR